MVWRNSLGDGAERNAHGNTLDMDADLSVPDAKAGLPAGLDNDFYQICHYRKFAHHPIDDGDHVHAHHQNDLAIEMSILYEVNLFVERDIEVSYRAWLIQHIAEILTLPGFLDAKSFDVEQGDNADVVAISVQYRLESRQALDNYFEHDAPRLRADGITKFGDGFKATRRVLSNECEYMK